jgi:GNAT superfamily N-acetyltransferase
MRIRLYDGDRETLRPLFREADDSDRAIDGYIAKGDLLVVEEDGDVVGLLLLVGEEIKSLAVVEARRGAGIGRALVEHAVRRARKAGAKRLLVSTAAADTGNLRFYQRAGFRMLRVDRDVFTPQNGYAGIVIDGIPLRDQVWLDREL